MKKLLGTFTVLISLAGAQIALASEDALHSSMMAISNQLHELETVPGATPDLKAIGPLVRRVIQTVRRGEPDEVQNATLQQAASVLEDYRVKVAQTFSPAHTYKIQHVTRPLQALKTALPSPDRFVLAIQQQLEGLRDDIEALSPERPPELGVQSYEAAIQSMLAGHNSLQKMLLMSVIVPGQSLALGSHFNVDNPSTAIVEWKAPKFLDSPEADTSISEDFDLVCPAIVPTDVWGRNLVLATIQNFAGKSVEVVLKSTKCLSPENAKAIGKIAKGMQAGKSIPGLVSAAASNRIASHYAAKLQNAPLPLIVSMFIAIKLLEQYSNPNMLAHIVTVPPVVQALDHWVLRPYAYKSAATACRYALEKVLQQQYLKSLFEKLTPKLGALIPLGIATRLSEGYKIGTSKAATGLATQFMISVYEISADAFSKEPAYVGFYLRGQKLAVDVTLGLTANVIIGAVMPTALVTLTPYVILGGFTLYYAPSVISYGSSFLW